MNRVSHIPFVLKSIPVLCMLDCCALYVALGSPNWLLVSLVLTGICFGLDIGLTWSQNEYQEGRSARIVAISAFYGMFEFLNVVAFFRE